MFDNYESKANLFYWCNPLAILSLLMGWVFLALLLNHPLFIIALFLIVILTMAAAGNLALLKDQLKFALPFILIIILINTLFNSHGETILFTVDISIIIFNLYLESLIYSLIAGLKILIIIMAFSFYSLVISLDEIHNLTAKLGYQISLIINMSLRLFPLIWTDYVRVQEIQKHRNPYKEEKGKLEKIKSFIPTLSILLTNSLNRSLKTAESLYSRGFGSGRTTTYNIITWRLTDYFLFINTLIIVTFALYLQLRGQVTYTFYPKLSSFSIFSIKALVIFSILLSLPVFLNWSCKLWLKSQ